ncbi:MAG: NHL repeat domain lipoprotein [Bacteroidetes bacterium HLUCCA01]|nr:MAG: NHL repeat domain lipoprotein [Bacteroidetes bacterium HLUCCA01]
MNMLKTNTQLLLVLIALSFTVSGCAEMFGTKSDDITDDIFDQGRQDPNLILEEVGYAALLPFWTDFDQPTDVFVGYDEMVYVTDANGLHVLDRAGRRASDVIPIPGAVSVVQDRLLNVYVAARIDTVIQAVSDDITWNLPAVYKIRNANGAGPLEFVQTLVHPFMDGSRAVSTTNRLFRLDRDRSDNDELVEITGVSILANNQVLVSRRGPRNITGVGMAPDNTVLIYDDIRDSDGQRTGQMRNLTQIRNLNPNNATLLSAVGLNDVVSFVAPPQRENMTTSQSFLVAQGAQNVSVPFRVLWVEAVETPDGLEFRSNGQLLNRDTTRADSFLYSEFRFENPVDLAYSADARGHIFVVDAAKDSLFLFQSNGFEGVPPPPGSSLTKAVNVSFGGTGSGPRQFNNPNGVAYFGRVVYVADTGNNRISRFKLNTDFE